MAQWYPRYPGDYLRDTADLSLVEHGIYSLLLDTYYATGKPLPADYYALYRIVGATKISEKEAVQRISNRFFAQNGDGHRHNNRADRELTKITEKSEAARHSVNKRWNKK